MNRGDKVVCVAADPNARRRGGTYDRDPSVGPQGLEEGKVYTVQNSGLYNWQNSGTVYSLWLEEIQRPNGKPFGAWRFRPVQEIIPPAQRQISSSIRDIVNQIENMSPEEIEELMEGAETENSEI